MTFSETVAPDFKANLTLVCDSSQRAQAGEAFHKAALHAREVLDRLDPQNPMGEVFQLMSHNTKGTFSISPDLAQILNTSQQVSLRLKEPLAKKLVVDIKNNEVTFKTDNILINIEPLLKGYLADLIMQDLEKAGWSNNLLETGGIYISRGRDFNGSWKIPVIDNTTATAHHAFFYKAGNIASATVNQDEKGVASIPSDLKSVTVFTEEGACRAQGMATAAFAAGFDNAKKILKVAGAANHSVLIDQNGKFVRIPD
ncbi:MAG: FAD:protein FMN transferase [Deltaproteobacteria bacterium]|nr:FAD:protein FMN transferase [Deltaproteobacteria bacterium]